ncbi:MAG: pyruvate kinase alpha/beta domain-containing protein, partial [Promethearchaeota archaeon]
MDFSGVFAKSLRKILSDGVKVCHEISMMAADSGLVKLGSDVISIGGTGRGADTVCWITANSSRDFLKTRIKAILVKPL